MELQESWNFSTPFYCYKGKWLGYLSYSEKRHHELYIGFIKAYKVTHKKLLSEGRKHIKVYRLNVTKDINTIELTKIKKPPKAQY